MRTTPRLFGTSGIRGIFAGIPVTDPLDDFIRGNVITPDLCRLLGEAVAEETIRGGCLHPIEIWQDVRESGYLLARAVMDGIRSRGVDAVYRGIAPTTLYTTRGDRWVIVVTASHNPIEFNGIKVFQDGRPIKREIEERLEHWIQQIDHSLSTDIEQGIRTIDGEGLPEPAQDTREIWLEMYRSCEALTRVETHYRSFLTSFFLPLDLAYGAAACPVDASGHIVELTPPIAAILNLGVPIVGYGCTRDPMRTNDRIGAAYAYGETLDHPDPKEIRAFASGEPGYGSPAERIVFWPMNQKDSNHAPLIPFFKQEDTFGGWYRVANDFSESSADVLIIHADRPGLPEPLQVIVKERIDSRIPLPGCMVDCDADRILITTPALAATQIPYLTGDGMIRFFIETAPPGTYSEVAFTVESGLALDVALERLITKFKSQSQPVFRIRKVTVGDRAIIDSFMDSDRPSCIGGEPSGHMVFCTRDSSGTTLVDDPFLTYIILMERVLNQGGSLDNILDQLFMVIPEVYCARKPDSRAGSGLTYDEKSRLELWEAGEWGRLSLYAGVFIPEYVRMYCEMLGDVFIWGSPVRCEFSDEWDRIKDGRIELPDTGWDLPLATAAFSHQQECRVFLHVDPRAWAGPDVIRIIFRVNRTDGETEEARLVGEGVFRNSGTSPKNAGYHKLWPENPISRDVVSESTLIHALTQLAARRAEFTNQYVIDNLRNGLKSTI
ncbi:hypothetical protein JXA80_12880 [bacterium]|nr:hypothetical protein [candidate division CSSED10-310 bacterium]